MADRICRKHRRRECSTCKTEARNAASAGTTADGTEAALWAAISDYGSSYGGGSCGGSSSGD